MKNAVPRFLPVSFVMLHVLIACAGAQDRPSFRSQSVSAPLIAVYADSGAWSDGIIAFEHFLDWKGIAHERVMRDDINRNDLRPRFSAIYFPGGYSGDYSAAITAVGDGHIRDLVNDGGGYIGICAGAYFAAKKIEWEGQTFAGELDLFDGRASGSLTAIRPWPGYGMTTISLNPRNPIASAQQHSMTTMYFGGPSFHPNAGAVMDTVATWDQAGDTPAVITTRYGAGRVLLIGPHPEIEENGSRDGTLFGGELRDPESEWGLLWPAVDWVLNRPITDTIATGIGSGAGREIPVTLEPNHPNPFSNRTTIRFAVPSTGMEQKSATIEITDRLGRRMALLDVDDRKPGMHALAWDSHDARPGVYYVILRTGSLVQTRPMLLVR